MELDIGAHNPKDDRVAELIREAELRLTEQLIESAEGGSVHAAIYLLDRAASQRIRDLNLPQVQCAEDGFEALRLIFNAVTTAQIRPGKAKELAMLLTGFVKGATVIDAQVGVAALEKRIRENEKRPRNALTY